jgi:cell division protein FtsN
MAEYRQRKVYSLNLTEGRIFIIFISLIIFTVIIFFGGAIILSQKSRTNSLAITESSDFEAVTTDEYSFYDNLHENEESFVNSTDTVYAPETFEMQQTVVTVDNHSTVNNEGNQFTNDTSSPQDLFTDNSMVTLDDSEVLYSSNENTQSTASTKTSETREETKKTTTSESTAATKKSTATVPGKRYVVQVGSYSKKQVADSMYAYYQGQGYPSYITQKTKDGTVYYRLRVGPFKARERADSYLDALKKSRYGKDSYISIVYL